MPVQMQEVESDAFTQVGYDEANQEVHVTFKSSGATWRYPMPQEMYDQFQSSDSKGRFFHKNVDKKKGQRA